MLCNMVLSGHWRWVILPYGQAMGRKGYFISGKWYSVCGVAQYSQPSCGSGGSWRGISYRMVLSAYVNHRAYRCELDENVKSNVAIG
jgi:hypothetical protein